MSPTSTDKSPVKKLQFKSDLERHVFDVLSECESYFLERADAEYFTDSPIPVGNEEMRLLCLTKEVMSRLLEKTND